ncbi:MAG: hypothetical protein K2L77_00530 [Muribaculaceae bacterium]|nr:hypothetical protein [Muribaculaceae bacterium]
MRKLYFLFVAACSCITAWASGTEPLKAAVPCPGMHTTLSHADKTINHTAADADYSEWKSLGTATLGDGYNYLEAGLNSYRKHGDERIVFANTTEVMMRHQLDNENLRQFKFCKFLGYNDVIADYDAVSCLCSISPTQTGMPVPGLLADNYGCEAIRFMCSSISYSDVRKIFTFNNPFFVKYDDMGFQSQAFEASLPDARPEVGFSFAVIDGGYRSTDTSITIKLIPTGVDHFRYVVRHGDKFAASDISDIVTGSIPYKEATTDFTIEYTEGYGYYHFLVLAFDPDDNYMGIFHSSYLFSNMTPEGTWKPIGRGIWHHPDTNEYGLVDFATGEVTNVVFPEESMQWEVDIEKRTDTDREIYRVVNPYSPSCGLAETFDSLLDRMYPGVDAEFRPDAFRTDDTFWFVFDVTDIDNISYQWGRPNGAGNSHFMGTSFYEPASTATQLSSFKDNRLCIADYTVYNDLIIDLPDTGAAIDLEADDTGYNIPAEYYDLQGRRVSEPSAGFYICRQGSRSSKVFVR